MSPRLALFLGGAAVCYLAGGWTVWQLWSVDSLQTEIADKDRQIDDLTAERDLKERQAQAAAAIADRNASDAADARARAAMLETQNKDLIDAFRDEAASRPDCNCGFSQSDLERLRRQITIGRPPAGAGP